MCEIDEKNYDEKKLFPPILAVDFDGTLVSDRFPEIGEPNWVIVKAVKNYQALGYKLILWTCRTDDLLRDAVDYCRSSLGIEFDAVNQNLPECQKFYGGDTRKVFANMYLDDRNAALFIGGEGYPSEIAPIRLVIGQGTILVEEPNGV